ncbi:MAG: GGDEF domain-containing protein, partial [Rhodanobacteraceae bacterium]
GKLLKKHSRGSDVDCRYGGEEFLLLLPDMNEQAARERAETLRMALASTPVEFEGNLITVTGSFGVACYPKHAQTGDSLISAADKALYAAKEAGRNRVEVYSASGAGSEQYS